MKLSLRLSALCLINNLMLSTAFVFLLAVNTFGQNPHYILDVNNRTVAADNLEFDIDISWSNADSVSNFEYSGGQFFFEFNPLIANGGALSYFYVLDPDTVSDLPVNLRPRNPMISGTQLRLATNNFPGPGNGFQMPADTSVRIVRMRIMTSALTFAKVPLNLTWRNGPENPFTKVSAYVGTLNTDITNAGSHTISIPDDSLSYPGLIANFFSNTRTIIQGQTVNFFDSTFGESKPVNWNWTFESGSPGTSSLKHPSGIRYDSPGTFDVTLISSDSTDSDTITKFDYVTVLPLCSASWVQTISVTDAGNDNDSLKLGISPSGTSGIDPCLGEYTIPPAPPVGLFDARMILPGGESSLSDIRSDSGNVNEWLIRFQPSESGYPFTFTWDPAMFPATGSFYLRDAATQSLVVVDMRSQNQYVLSDQNINSVLIEYVNETVITSVKEGWNIVSVPVTTPDMYYLTAFPDAISQAYTFDDGYVTVDSLKVGKGYWIKFPDAGNYNFTGFPPDPAHISVDSNWNMIGPYDRDIPVSTLFSNPPGIIASNFFEFDDGYEFADTLKAGKGYWVKCNDEGYLYEVIIDGNPPAFAGDEFGNLVELKFENASGNSVLYLGNESELTSDFSLPPVPPLGIFDARFDGDRFAASYNTSQTVRINSAGAETFVSLSNSNGKTFLLRDAVSGNILNEKLEEGGRVIVPANLEFIIVDVINTVPLTFELFQNYPNPFNPVTTIKYQIPEAGNVRLAIFDVLGREILSPVNSRQEPGTYSVRINASDLASGVYFYKLTMPGHSEIKRMVVLK